MWLFRIQLEVKICSLYIYPIFWLSVLESEVCVHEMIVIAITSFRSLGYPPLGTQTITFHLLLSLQFTFFLLCDLISFFSVASFVSFVLPTFLWLNTMLVYSVLSFLLQVLWVWIFVIDGKCEFFSLKVIFFPPKLSLKAADLLWMFKEELNFWKLPHTVPAEVPAFEQC